MHRKSNHSPRSLTYLGCVAALSLLECLLPSLVSSATVTPFDEPPCYMRTQDGRLVNLQSLCRHTTSPPTQANPVTNQSPQRTAPQAAPTQVLPTRARDVSGSHAQGNPDSDDGRY